MAEHATRGAESLEALVIHKSSLIQENKGKPLAGSSGADARPAPPADKAMQF